MQKMFIDALAAHLSMYDGLSDKDFFGAIMIEVFLFSVAFAFLSMFVYDRLIKPYTIRLIQWLKDFIQLNKEAYEALDEDMFELH
jgi:hypothetical protein